MVQLSNFTLGLSLWETGNWMVTAAQQRLGLISEQSISANTTTITTTTMAYSLPPLGYAYDALEPHFDAETMEIHHAKHHQTYVTNLNAAVGSHATLSTLAVEDLIARLGDDNEGDIPADQRTAVRNAGGGHANHSVFWKGLRKGTTLAAGGALETALVAAFGSVDAFQEQFQKAATTVFGSGWAWLIVPFDDHGAAAALKIVTTANQDSPLMPTAVSGAERGVPVLALDVWEHAYYLKFRNRRPDYIKEFWSVVDWEEAEARFARAAK